MANFLKNIIQLVLFGGLTKDEYKRIGKDILYENRRTLLLMPAISIIAFFLTVIVYPYKKTAPIATYLICIAFLFVLIIMNVLFKQSKFLITFGVFLFTVVLYAAGIYISGVIGINDLASTFMVFLIVIPLLFVVRPIIMDLTVLIADVLFLLALVWMKQDPSMFVKNRVNAIVYGFLSIVIGTVMMKIKMERMNRGWENRYLSETDQLTGLPNRRSYEYQLDKIVNDENYNDYTIGIFDMNGLKQVNDTLGHSAGDKLIRGAACCVKCFEKYGKVFRTGGDEFVAVIFIDDKNLDDIVSEFTKTVSEWHSENINELSVSCGFASHNEFSDKSIYEIIKIADKRMYASKSEFYRQKGVDRRSR